MKNMEKALAFSLGIILLLTVTVSVFGQRVRVRVPHTPRSRVKPLPRLEDKKRPPDVGSLPRSTPTPKPTPRTGKPSR